MTVYGFSFAGLFAWILFDMKKEVVRSSETSVKFYGNKWSLIS
jgi:hypothetical protein